MHAKTKLTIEVSAEQRERIERIVKPRDKVLSLHFNTDDIEAWKGQARANGESLTDLIERVMNALGKDR